MVRWSDIEKLCSSLRRGEREGREGERRLRGRVEKVGRAWLDHFIKRTMAHRNGFFGANILSMT